MFALGLVNEPTFSLAGSRGPGLLATGHLPTTLPTMLEKHIAMTGWEELSATKKISVLNFNRECIL